MVGVDVTRPGLPLTGHVQRLFGRRLVTGIDDEGDGLGRPGVHVGEAVARGGSRFREVGRVVVVDAGIPVSQPVDRGGGGPRPRRSLVIFFGTRPLVTFVSLVTSVSVPPH